MNWTWVVAAALAYLIGSFPTAYVVALRWAGVDIRTVGSGNVGGSNMRAVQGVWATIAVGVIDLLKGAGAVWLTVMMGLGTGAACVAAVAVVVGHDWSVWLSLQGGRGGASSLGTLLVLFPLGFLWVVGFMAIGKLTRSTAVLHLCGVITLPAVAGLMRQGNGIVITLTVLAVIMVIKRLEANQRFQVPLEMCNSLHAGPMKAGTGRARVYGRRLLLDRDSRWASDSQSSAES